LQSPPSDYECRRRTACRGDAGREPDPSIVITTTIGLSSPEVVADPYPYFAAAREVAPVQWHDGLGMWLTFTHAAANAVLRTRTLGRIWTPRWPDEPMPAFALIHVNSLLENEPPAHTRMRRLVAGAFARGHVERLRPWVAELAARLADNVADAGSDGSPVDLISTYAEPLPVEVIAELLGFPQADRHHLRPWSNAIVKMYEYDVSSEQKVAAEQASADFVDYLRAVVTERRSAPSDDLISSLIAETDSDGARLTEDELITTCTLLLNAGHEATVNVVGNGVTALLAHPDQLDAVRADDGLVDSCVEELIRYDSPLQLFERTAIEETVIEDVTVAQGEKIAALLGAANRDPAVFAEPDRFDVTRADNPHLGFGAGIHFCVGAPLARVELQTSLRTLLSRFPELALAETPQRRPEFVIRGVRSLPVTI
jgi:cytochrome P450